MTPPLPAAATIMNDDDPSPRLGLSQYYRSHDKVPQCSGYSITVRRKVNKMSMCEAGTEKKEKTQ